jgi:hypothetical protein
MSPFAEKRVFVSYAHEDRAFVEILHEALTRAGYEIWHDRFLAREYRQEISEAIGTADHGIVVWSQASVARSFVRDEANHLM